MSGLTIACLRCGSPQRIAPVRVMDKGEGNGQHDLRLRVDGDPDALIFKDRIYSTVHAEVCADCGHVVLIADDPQELRQAAQRAAGGG